MTAGQPRDHFGVRRIRPAVVVILALLFASPGPAHGKGKRGGSGGSVYVHGYIRSDGTYVAPHYRSAPDGDPTNNWSTKGNTNPYTGEAGTKNPSPATPLRYGSSPVPASASVPALTGVEAVGSALPVDDDRPAQTASQPTDDIDSLVDSVLTRPATGHQSERATPAASKPAPPRPGNPPEGASFANVTPVSGTSGVELIRLDTKESYFLVNARLDEVRQREFEWFLRSRRTAKTQRIAPRLAMILYRTGLQFVGHRLEIVSGYRDPKATRDWRGAHEKGLACDLRVDGIADSILREYLRLNFDHIGLGFYPNAPFVHLETRAGPSQFWIDYSSPAENTMELEASRSIQTPR